MSPYAFLFFGAVLTTTVSADVNQQISFRNERSNLLPSVTRNDILIKRDPVVKLTRDGNEANNDVGRAPVRETRISQQTARTRLLHYPYRNKRGIVLPTFGGNKIFIERNPLLDIIGGEKHLNLGGIQEKKPVGVAPISGTRIEKDMQDNEQRIPRVFGSDNDLNTRFVSGGYGTQTGRDTQNNKPNFPAGSCNGKNCDTGFDLRGDNGYGTQTGRDTQDDKPNFPRGFWNGNNCDTGFGPRKYDGNYCGSGFEFRGYNDRNNNNVGETCKNGLCYRRDPNWRKSIQVEDSILERLAVMQLPIECVLPSEEIVFLEKDNIIEIPQHSFQLKTGSTRDMIQRVSENCLVKHRIVVKNPGGQILLATQ